jgi:23S rRNA-/tRNA-specific pseudouridylate synthase
MINEGLIKINGKPSTPEHVLKQTDLLEYDDIRTDKPIIDFTQIEVIHEDDYFFVIQKPCSVPVHPKGRYLKNSLTMILQHEYGLKDLKLLHRLDKVTSGVLVCNQLQHLTRLDIWKNSVCCTCVYSYFEDKPSKKVLLGACNWSFQTTN